MAQSDTSRSGASAQGVESSSPQSDQAESALQSAPGNEASNIGSEAKQLAENVADRARDTAQDRLSNGKERAARSLGTVADALRHTGQHLRLQDEESLPGYIDRAAEKLDSVSGYLRDKELRDVLGDIESFARREPALFIGGAFALGLLGGRFLKSSGSGRRESGESAQAAEEARPAASATRPAERSPQRRKGQRASEPRRSGGEMAFSAPEAMSANGDPARQMRPGDG